MKRLHLTILVSLLYLSSGCNSLDGVNEHKYPVASELPELIGTPTDSDTFKSFVNKYELMQYHKDENSWASRYGVFVTANKKVVAIGLRPKSKGNGTPSFYPGKLPFALEPREDLKTILKKVGEPISIKGLDNAYSELSYSNFTIYVMWGELFEVWFHAKLDQTKLNEPSYSYAAISINGKIYLKPLFDNADPFGPFSLDEYGCSYVHFPEGRPHQFHSAQQIYHDEVNNTWLFSDNCLQMRALPVNPRDLLKKLEHNNAVQGTSRGRADPDR